MERKPAHLAEAAGLFYDEFRTLTAPVDVTAWNGVAVGEDSDFSLSPGAAGTRWVYGLQPQGAQVLASYNHVHFGRWPALTTNTHRNGRITYVGTVPNEPLARDILQWAVRDRSAWRPITDSQTVTGATARDGNRLRFVCKGQPDSGTLGRCSASS
jgi:beta-galactosidase